MWLYDSNFNAIPCGGDDDNLGPPTSLQSRLSINLTAGTYYLGVSTYNLANNQPSCAGVDNFLTANARRGCGKRDMVSNINWFMNVPVEADGALGIVDGISAPGLYVDLRAEMDLMAVVSNCPQINNPCNGFNPTPVRMIVAQ